MADSGYDDQGDAHLDEINDLQARVDELESDLGVSERKCDKLFEINGHLSQRCDDLEHYIVRIRGALPGPKALKKVHVKALTKILPDILAYANSITRGTGTAANFEYQFRHAEHRAKLTKAVNVQAKKMMASMIVTVGSIADRTANSVNPEDIHHLREELDHLTANHEIVEHTSVDAYLDGVMPELDPMAEADLARRMKK